MTTPAMTPYEWEGDEELSDLPPGRHRLRVVAFASGPGLNRRTIKDMTLVVSDNRTLPPLASVFFEELVITRKLLPFYLYVKVDARPDP